MLKGQNMYNRYTVIDFIPYLVAPDEMFVPITDKIVKGVKPYYLISNYGRIYLRHNTTPWMLYSLDTKGYWLASLATYNGPSMIRVHRIVKMAFDYIPGCEEMVVDHLDGNKRNPCLKNLEWVTHAENTRRGFVKCREYGDIPPQITPQYLINDMDYIKKMRLEIEQEKEMKKQIPTDYTQKNFNDLKSNFNCQSVRGGSNRSKTSHSDDEVHMICKMLQEGYTTAYIATKLQIKKSYVAAVYHGQARCDISCKYDFSNYGTIAYHDKWVFTPEQVHAICQYLCDNDITNPVLAPSKKYYIQTMLSKLNIAYSEAKYIAILDMLKGRGYTSITKQYNFAK